MTERTGQCMCGAVTVTATPARESISACHCEMCQRWASGPYLSFQAATGYAALGPVQTYESSGWAERAFCETCGSSLWYRMTADGSMHGQNQVAAGLFENAGGLSPKLELYIDKKPMGYAFEGERRTMTEAEVVAMYAPSDEGEPQ